MSFTIINWNVNSIKARFNQFLLLLKESNPDIICLQEIKCSNDNFPTYLIEDLGYNVAINGQKTYNGVAILSKFPIEEISTSFNDDPDPLQARYIEIVVSIKKQIYRIVSVYVPNGQAIGTDKFFYKINFIQSLYIHFKKLLSYREKLVICGDFNIAPFDYDIYDPIKLEGLICTSSLEKNLFRKFIFNGLHDSFRLKYPDKIQFSWWDYRGRSWETNSGLRIDHILLSSEAADYLIDVKIDPTLRAQPKSSDHAPIHVLFNEG